MADVRAEVTKQREITRLARLAKGFGIACLVLGIITLLGSILLALISNYADSTSADTVEGLGHLFAFFGAMWLYWGIIALTAIAAALFIVGFIYALQNKIKYKQKMTNFYWGYGGLVAIIATIIIIKVFTFW